MILREFEAQVHQSTPQIKKTGKEANWNVREILKGKRQLNDRHPEKKGRESVSFRVNTVAQRQWFRTL